MQFKDIVGQQKVKQHLLSTARSGKIPHAQLFLGKEGSGGLALALAFAQYLDCENPQETDSCGTCPSCNKAAKMIHPDIHYTFPVIPRKTDRPPLCDDFLVEWRKKISTEPYINEYDWLQFIGAENKQGNITALEARNIIKKLSLKTFESQYKILILWKPEALGKEGNILLKLIEEPPDDTILLLVAENSEEILLTILSRVQIVKLENLSDTEVSKALIEKINISESKAIKSAFLANGNFREALQLAQNNEEEWEKDLAEWFTVSLNNQAVNLVKWVETKAGSGRENIKQFMEYTLHFLRESLVMLYSSEVTPRFTEAEALLAKRLARFLNNEDKIQLFTELLEKSHYQVERNCNPKIVLLDLSIKMEKILRGKPILVHL